MTHTYEMPERREKCSGSEWSAYWVSKVQKRKNECKTAIKRKFVRFHATKSKVVAPICEQTLGYRTEEMTVTWSREYIFCKTFNEDIFKAREIERSRKNVQNYFMGLATVL